MSEYRPIKTEIWRGRWFPTLTSDEKVVWIFLLTNELFHISGIYSLPKPLVSPFTGVSNTDEILEKFERDGKIIYRDGYVFIVNYLTNQTKQIISKKDNIHKSIIAYLKENPRLIELFDLENRDPYKALLSPSEAPYKPLGRPLPKEERGKRKEERGKIKGVQGEKSPSASIENSENKKNQKPESSIDWLRDIPPDDIERLQELFRIDEKIIRGRAQDVINYCESKGKRYVDYRAALRTFIKSYIEKHPNEVQRPVFGTTEATPVVEVPTQTEEERLAGIANLEKIRADLARKKSMKPVNSPPAPYENDPTEHDHESDDDGR